MNDKIFVNGMVVKRNDNAPEYVLANLSIKRADLIDFLRQQDSDWLNVALKRAKSGKCYAELDTWKPSEKLADVARGSEPPRGGHWEERRPAAAPTAADDDIPF